jgi:hypothetical protein
MGQGPERKAFWGEMVSTSIPQVLMGPVADELKKRFLRKFAVNHGASLIGKAAPFGIGAAIGGVGNNIAGRQVITAARTAFGPAPYLLPLELETIESERPPRRKLPFVRRRAITAGPMSTDGADVPGTDALTDDDAESSDRR